MLLLLGSSRLVNITHDFELHAAAYFGSTFKYYGRGFTACKTVEQYSVLVIIIANPILKMIDLCSLKAGRRPRAGRGQIGALPICEARVASYFHPSQRQSARVLRGSSFITCPVLSTSSESCQGIINQGGISCPSGGVAGLSWVSALGTQKLRT